MFTLDGFQMVLDVLPAPARVEVVALGPADSAAMRALVERTKPGPFWERTHEMGRYVGVRDGDRLVAMAGERLRPPGATEISAVCTAPEARGRGLAAALVTDAAHAIAARGEQPFLHVAASNTGAIALYERLGFRVRQAVVFRGYRVPGQHR
ncbi:GNAT family N-acetyltransferase [Nocardioides convexus]|uniref:GNAT family N-acetyltransferase n=1 Tax=Nocardioides convexus TaxID=2712224 RepID=UPI0024186FBF|nr:GNAT family N-acetyltransferase [Nocardioides convexus]